MVNAEREHAPIESFEIDKEPKVVTQQVLWPADYPLWDSEATDEAIPWPILPGLNLGSDSYVLGFTGPRGSGKTSLMTYTAEQCAWLYDKRIVSNYAIDFAVTTGPGKINVYHADPLDIGKLLTFDADYKDCIIVLDEAPQVINRLATMTWKNRLLDLFLQQLRKSRISFLYASQNEGAIHGDVPHDLDHGWVDGALRFQTDVLVFCRDVSRLNHTFTKGATIRSVWVDKSGLWSGFSFFERPRSLKLHTETQKIWGTFDTNQQFDVFESLAKVKVNAPTYEIGQPQEEDDAHSDYMGKAELVARTAMDRGGMPSIEFYDAVGPLTDKQKHHLGERLRKAGVRRGGQGASVLKFDNFDMEKFLNG